MEKKQGGFFSALKHEVARGLSPGKSRRSKSADMDAQPPRGGGGGGEVLTAVMEGPDACGAERGERKEGWGRWVRGQLTRAAAPPTAGEGGRRSDLRLLLGVMGAPLAPVHVCASEPLPHLSVKDTPIETSSAQYILQQYIAASGGQTLLKSIKSTYTSGTTRMSALEFQTAGGKVVRNRRSSGKAAEAGRFVIWSMQPEMWYIELALGGSKVHAGSNGRIVWRHTPWLGAHAAKGPVRPLRRALQGLDPLTTAIMFSDAICIGEKKVNTEDCFVLKLCTDSQTLKSRSTASSAEIIRHVAFGYFSQRTGLLIKLEDSHLTRSNGSNGSESVYWETNINTEIGEYKNVDGVLVGHKGKSKVSLMRFGEVALSQRVTRMEEIWEIDEVAFNVKGVGNDCFIPPRDLKAAICGEESRELESRDLKSWDLKGGICGEESRELESRDLKSWDLKGGSLGKKGGKVRDDWRVED
ncbi:hypothetical protein LUZ60_004943 [Juncus effusus]|nr:hypothetical protein LUZ60_004943 [Juncus effusus]